MAVCVAAGVASFATLIAFWKTSAHTITSLYGAVAFSLFYWFAGEILPEPLTWAVRAAAIALATTWFVRTLKKEKPFLERAAAPPAAPAGTIIGSGARSLARRASNAPEITFVPDNKRVAPKPGQTLLEAAEAAGMTIEAGCRMGVCGADPVAIKSGLECTSPVNDDELATLGRLGYAPNTRMACCVKITGPVEVALTPDKAETPALSRVSSFNYDRTVGRVVVIGNGIAGVTAADHLRRRHPDVEIDLIAEEPHHLYNRMGISRLVYGRSAMQGLYLNPDAWYDERRITAWLNTRALGIDRDKRLVTLGTGERLQYDRLILATGSSSFVPPIEGFGAPGTAVLRSADDAIRLRAFAQRPATRRAAIAGGGLLGLEAAYALHKLGLKTVVLERSDRLLRRQLDARAAEILRNYLEGLGLEFVMEAKAESVDANGRLRAVNLSEGRSIEAHILLVAAGIQPNVELAREAGLKVKRGVLVDERMRTADPDIVAAGDVAEYEGQLPGLWPTAVAQAEVAADTVAGGEKTYTGAVPVTILKVVGIELTSIGRFERTAPDDEVIALEGDAGTKYRKLVISGGRIIGAILLGYGREVTPVRAAITNGADVTSHLGALRKGQLGRAREPGIAARVAGVFAGMKPRIRTAPRRIAVLAIAAGVPIIALPAAANAAVTPAVNGTTLTLTGDAAAENITLGVDAAGLITHSLGTGANGLASTTDFDPDRGRDDAAVRRHDHRRPQRRRRQRQRQLLRAEPRGRHDQRRGRRRRDPRLGRARHHLRRPRQRPHHGLPRQRDDPRRRRQRRHHLEQR